jgi:hypothetical protein
MSNNKYIVIYIMFMTPQLAEEAKIRKNKKAHKNWGFPIFLPSLFLPAEQFILHTLRDRLARPEATEDGIWTYSVF